VEAAGRSALSQPLKAKTSKSTKPLYKCLSKIWLTVQKMATMDVMEVFYNCLNESINNIFKIKISNLRLAIFGIYFYDGQQGYLYW
jgi:hypothetical protein